MINNDQPILSTDHQPRVWTVELDNREDNDLTGLVGVYATRDAAANGVVESAAEFGLDQTSLDKTDEAARSFFVENTEGTLFWTAQEVTVVG